MCYGYIKDVSKMVHQKPVFQSEASEEGDQLGKVFHAAKLRGTYILHVHVL